MGIPYVEDSDGDTVRGATYWGLNSDMESMENSISNVMVLEAGGSGVGPKAQSWYGVTIVTMYEDTFWS